MINLKQSGSSVFICFVCLAVMLFGCLTPKKLDKFVAAQYGNELPKPNKKKKAEIEVTSLSPTGNSYISTTVHKTDKFLPLLIYWKYDHRQKCSLNPAIVPARRLRSGSAHVSIRDSVCRPWDIGHCVT